MSNVEVVLFDHKFPDVGSLPPLGFIQENGGLTWFSPDHVGIAVPPNKSDHGLMSTFTFNDVGAWCEFTLKSFAGLTPNSFVWFGLLDDWNIFAAPYIVEVFLDGSNRFDAYATVGFIPSTLLVPVLAPGDKFRIEALKMNTGNTIITIIRNGGVIGTFVNPSYSIPLGYTLNLTGLDSGGGGLIEIGDFRGGLIVNVTEDVIRGARIVMP